MSETSLNSFAYVEPNKYSVEKWLREWLELYANGEAVNIHLYEGYVRIHLVPEIGQIKLTSLRHQGSPEVL